MSTCKYPKNESPKNHLNANLSAGNSVWKSLEILGVTFGIFNIRATISFPCHFPRYKVPEWDCAIAFDKLNDLMSTPVYLDKVASRVLVFVPFQFSSLYGIFCLVFWPFSAAISTNMNFYGTIMNKKRLTFYGLPNLWLTHIQGG